MPSKINISSQGFEVSKNLLPQNPYVGLKPKSNSLRTSTTLKHSSKHLSCY